MIFIAAVFSAPATLAADLAADLDACLGCHEKTEFAGLSAEDIGASLKDPKLKAHGQFRQLSDAEIQAIADEL